MVVLDTNILIDHLMQLEDKNSLLMKIAAEQNSDSLFISVMTIQELYEGRSTRQKENLQYMLSVIAPLSVISYDLEIAKLAGKIARDLKNPIEFADAAIAATCIYNNAELFTLNKKHFKDIPDLSLYELEI